jgi:hypothetical protein
MTRNEAGEKLSAAIEALPEGPKQAAARASVARLLGALAGGARRDVIEDARSNLLAVLPGLEPAVDRILAEQVLIRVEQVLNRSVPKPGK